MMLVSSSLKRTKHEIHHWTKKNYTFDVSVVHSSRHKCLVCMNRYGLIVGRVFFSRNITSSMLCATPSHVQVTKFVDSCVVQSAYPKGSLVELLHPQYDTKIVGKGRA